MADYQQAKPNEQAPVATPTDVMLEQLAWLREAAKEVSETEAACASEPKDKEDFPLETAGIEPFEFQLANGNDVKVVFARFWERIRYQDWREGARPAQYYAIKVYSTEDILSGHLAIHCEFRGGKDFTFPIVPKIWDWMDELVKSRQYAEFDSLADFIDELAEEMNRLVDTEMDAVEHFEHLPEVVAPADFDKVDDSLFNDHNDPTA